MTPLQIVGLGLRLFAIFLALTAIGYLVPAVTTAEVEGGDVLKQAGVVVGGLYVLAAIVIWLFPKALAKTLLPTSDPKFNVRPGLQEVAHVGVTLLGLWLIAQHLPGLVWYVMRSIIIAMTPEVGNVGRLNVDAKADIAVSAFNVIVAGVLVARSGQVSKYFLERNQESSNKDP